MNAWEYKFIKKIKIKIINKSNFKFYLKFYYQNQK